MSVLRARWRERTPRTPRALRAGLALLMGTGALLLLANPRADAVSKSGTGKSEVVVARPTLAEGPRTKQGGKLLASPNSPDKSPAGPEPGEPSEPASSSPAVISAGRTLFVQSCSACHGIALEGRKDLGPALQGTGAGPAQFYLSTGRMPLPDPRMEPMREPPLFDARQIKELVAYVASYGGPAAPVAQPSRGSLSVGLHTFTLNCAGCHQVVARGGLTIGAVVPDLEDASADQVAEAVRMGPYLMPHFDAKDIDQYELDSLARYVLWTRHPANQGGWGIYNLGPIPEGIVAWFLLLLTLVLLARLIGERTA